MFAKIWSISLGILVSKLSIFCLAILFAVKFDSNFALPSKNLPRTDLKSLPLTLLEGGIFISPEGVIPISVKKSCTVSGDISPLNWGFNLTTPVCTFLPLLLPDGSVTALSLSVLDLGSTYFS